MSNELILSDYSNVSKAVDQFNASSMVTILNPGQSIVRPEKILPDAWLRLSFYDVKQLNIEGYPSPKRGDIEELVKHGNEWIPGSSMVVHCASGQSRSAAAIIILLASLNPGQETEIITYVREKAKHVTPNRPMINFADQVLGCDGRLIEGVNNIRLPTMNAFIKPIAFASDLGDINDKM